MSRPSGRATWLAPLLFLSFLTATLGPLAQPARAADDAEAEARRHFNRGKQLYDERKYRDAAEEFEAGYAILPKVGFLLNIGHSYRRAGDLKKAKRYYELFLDKDKGSPQRDEVQAYIKSIDETLADQAGDDTPAEAPKVIKEVKPPPAPEPTPAAPVHVDACAERAAAGGAPVWPWLVSGAAIVIAGGIAAAVVLTHSGKSDPCGTLGCLNER
jgi:tetratricopeptide (TPR) repeat protein